MSPVDLASGPMSCFRINNNNNACNWINHEDDSCLKTASEFLQLERGLHPEHSPTVHDACPKDINLVHDKVWV